MAGSSPAMTSETEELDFMGHLFSGLEVRSATLERIASVMIGAYFEQPELDKSRQHTSDVRMDRQTKFTLWVAFLVLFSYVAWFYLDCAMDETCHLVCHAGGRGGCYTQRSAPAETGH